jgi:hypothetical protein
MQKPQSLSAGDSVATQGTEVISVITKKEDSCSNPVTV